jgi:hypothetical protein
MQLIEGDSLPLQGHATVGSLHIDNRTLTAYIRQLSLVYAFTSMHVFRQTTPTEERHVTMTGLEFLKLKDLHKLIVDIAHAFAHYSLHL